MISSPWSKGAFILVAIIIAFYVSQNWVGEATWEKAQSDIAAAGESLDPKKVIPPPIPDDVNFGALSYFQVMPGGRYPRLRIQNDLARIGDHIPYSKDGNGDHDALPFLGDWSKGEQPDLPAIQKRFTELAASLPKEKAPQSTDPLSTFATLGPALAELRLANATHPECRFDQDYTSQPPFNRTLASITYQIRVAQILAYEERLAFIEKRPQLAMDDLMVTLKLNAGLRKEPILVSGLVAIGSVAIQLSVVRQGLTERAWDEQQLKEIDENLGKIDFLSDSQLCSRGETILDWIPTSVYLRDHSTLILDLVRHSYTYSTAPSHSPADLGFILGCWLVPRGWFDEFKAVGAKVNLLGMVPMVDPVLRRVYPEKETHAISLGSNFSSLPFLRDYVDGFFPPIIKSVSRFAFAQAEVDQARIACRLGRYHLAQGRYPKALEELIPTYGADLPNDIMNGAPYHYKLNADGTYILYSVGWNQKDDGGDGSSSSYGSVTDAPDWVWKSYPDK